MKLRFEKFITGDSYYVDEEDGKTFLGIIHRRSPAGDPWFTKGKGFRTRKEAAEYLLAHRSEDNDDQVHSLDGE